VTNLVNLNAVVVLWTTPFETPIVASVGAVPASDAQVVVPVYVLQLLNEFVTTVTAISPFLAEVFDPDIDVSTTVALGAALVTLLGLGLAGFLVVDFLVVTNLVTVEILVLPTVAVGAVASCCHFSSYL
jgi:hypothetical protein